VRQAARSEVKTYGTIAHSNRTQRGGVGVRCTQLASVVEEAQKFFYLLAEDIHVDQTKATGWVFDFGNESLNFTAEFVGR